MSDDQLLDEVITTHNEFSPLETADLGLRLANALIDSLMFTGINLALTFGLGIDIPLISYAISFLYYLLLEGTTGKTLGKLVTGTIVVTETGGKPEMGTIALRCICRWVPFEAFSFFRSSRRGWHDTWSKTYVIKGNNYIQI